MAKKKRKSKSAKRRSAIGPLGLPAEYADQMELGSLAEVASSLGVSVGKLKRWRKTPGQKELNGGRPYNLGRVALQLITESHISLDKLPELAQKSIAVHLALTAIEKDNERKQFEIVNSVLAEMLKENEERMRAHGISEEDWDLFEQVLEDNGYTEHWFNEHADDDLTELQAYRNCVEMLPKNKRKSFKHISTRRKAS